MLRPTVLLALILAIVHLAPAQNTIDLPITLEDRARAACRAGDYDKALRLLDSLAPAARTPETDYLTGIAQLGLALRQDAPVLLGERHIRQYRTAMAGVDRAANRQPEIWEPLRAAVSDLPARIETVTETLAPDREQRDARLQKAFATFDRLAAQGHPEAPVARAWAQFAAAWCAERDSAHVRDIVAELLTLNPAAAPTARLNAAHMLALLGAHDDTTRLARELYERPTPWLMLSNPTWAQDVSNRLPRLFETLRRILPRDQTQRLDQMRRNMRQRLTPERVDELLQVAQQRAEQWQAERRDRITEARATLSHALTLLARDETGVLPDAGALVAHPMVSAAWLYREVVTDDHKTGAYAASLAWLALDEPQSARFLQWARRTGRGNAAWDLETVRRTAVSNPNDAYPALATALGRPLFARPVLEDAPSLLLPALYQWERLRPDLAAFAGSLEMVTAFVRGQVLGPLTREQLDRRTRLAGLLARSNLPHDRALARSERTATLRAAMRTPNLLTPDERARARAELAQLREQIAGQRPPMLVVSADGVHELRGVEAFGALRNQRGQRPLLLVSPEGRTIPLPPRRERDRRGARSGEGRRRPPR